MAVWDATADPGLLSVLHPGVPGDLHRGADVVVVGGGAVGLATAAACRREGLGRVLVLEAGRLAGTASGRAAGILAPEPHAWSEPAAFVELGRRSLRLTWELDAETGGALGVRSLASRDGMSTPISRGKRLSGALTDVPRLTKLALTSSDVISSPAPPSRPCTSP